MMVVVVVVMMVVMVVMMVVVVMVVVVMVVVVVVMMVMMVVVVVVVVFSKNQIRHINSINVDTIINVVFLFSLPLLPSLLPCLQHQLFFLSTHL